MANGGNPDLRRRPGKRGYGRGARSLRLADRERMFVSSANLTEQAVSINTELGVLITGPHHPAAVEDHFNALASSRC
jgi:hypothetical protein